ncbi:MAG TPA: DUF5693 family protein [Trueperaceae bacterium]|nr:DUF5693 family protein [Trueperaceae bacterium]
MRKPLERVALVVMLLALIPAAVLAVRRVRAEGSHVAVAMVMDEQALADQAALVGLTSLELAQRYQRSGLSGVALYEDNIESLVAKGYAVAMLGSELRAQALARGEPAPPVPDDSTLVSALVPGALDRLIEKNVPSARAFEYLDRTWYVWPGDVRTTLPAGPDAAELARWSAAGFDIAYRPRNAPYLLLEPGADFPSEASYLIYAGTQVGGHPFASADEDTSRLDALVERSQGYLTAIIEGTPQDGLNRISSRVPTVRLLSFNQDYVDRRLRPAELVDKYLLAVTERNVRLLYLRPYTTTELGDPIANTERMIASLSAALASQGYVVERLATLDTQYMTSAPLRLGAALGVLAGLVLLALGIPAPWGTLAAVMLAMLAVAAAGPSWDAVALLAALTFPVLGYLRFNRRVSDIVVVTALSLAGALFLVGVGSERDTLLAIRPFAGVGATLVVPPVVFLAAVALRRRNLASWLKLGWHAEIRFWHAAVAGLAAMAVGVVLLRRGNDPVIGVSQLELGLRQLLGEYFARPRFKELIGHPLAVLGLGMRAWPGWLRALLLTGGVIAQASVLNSFSHYHTPLSISLERTVAALIIGVVVGLLLLVVARWLTRWLGRWLASAPDPGVAAATAGPGPGPDPFTAGVSTIIPPASDEPTDA